ncbi:MAG TPA: hypothetical protein PLF50_03770 [Candidatus Cloacimonadota bacterium]|nr:hypothetical protein [Candidatus Cloacimonadota bacterium]
MKLLKTRYAMIAAESNYKMIKLLTDGVKKRLKKKRIYLKLKLPEAIWNL